VLLLTELRRFVSFAFVLVLTDPLRFALSSLLSPSEERRRVVESVSPFATGALLVDPRRLSLLPRAPFERLKLAVFPSLSRRVLTEPRRFASLVLLLTELRRFVSFAFVLVLTDPLRFALSSLLSPSEERRRVVESVSPFATGALLVDPRRLSLLPRAPFERLKLAVFPSLSLRVVDGSPEMDCESERRSALLAMERGLSLLPRFSERLSLPISLLLPVRLSALPRFVEPRKLPSLPLRRIL